MARILLIDDEASMRIMAKKVLCGDGHEVVTAANGREGLQCSADQPFDLVITDMIMPRLDQDGVDLIKELRQRCSKMPIIAISGGNHVSANDCLAMAKKLGVNFTLAKPFSRKELLAAVAAVLGLKKDVIHNG